MLDCVNTSTLSHPNVTAEQQCMMLVPTFANFLVYFLLSCIEFQAVCLFSLVGFLTSSSTTRLYRGRVPKLTSDNCTCCHTETERGYQDFCLSRSHYTDTGHSGNRTKDLLTRSRTLYRLSHRTL